MVFTYDEFIKVKAQKQGIEFLVTVDFGQKQVEAKIEGDWLIIEKTHKISLKSRIKPDFCYILRENELRPIAFFDEGTSRFYKLFPTSDWPTITISSVPMHRKKGLSPKKDTENKISLIKPYGVVLDTCMGLGYTAILASKTSKMIYSFEKDENVYFISELNPVSSELFSSSKITVAKADISEQIKQFDNNFFDCIIHDPPTFKIAPNLYSNEFYLKIKRVLKPEGRFFHYTPFYGIKRGIDFPKRIRTNLEKTGFNILKFEPDLGGIVCGK